MKKPAYLLLAAALTAAPLIPAVASAHGGYDRGGHDRARYEHRDHRDWHHHRRPAKRHWRGYGAPTVVYRDYPRYRYYGRDGLTVIYQGHFPLR
jgi:hypothetical protein